MIDRAKKSNENQGAERHRIQLREAAKAVSDANHDVQARYQIAKALVALGFPEIASGEAQKTLMLIEAGLDQSTALGETVRSKLKITSSLSTEACTYI